ncbi:hypothetical protein SteCoe_21225 [Stentor coeruleus]|uniref:Lipid-binding serum glycoprotein C-terminal domain-containing protein n=1 Tax=Stentor coeruleus TaxID=5963 RepID=A0A1R2BPZ9_9CILI|nr:hypothetical protein SteCoe_21225 [Stentor coeruleus]
MKVFVVALILTVCIGAKTGAIIGMTPEAVNSVLEDFLPQFSAQIQQGTFNDMHFPSVGKGSLTVDLDVYNLTIPVFNVDHKNSGVAFTSDRKIIFTLQDVTSTGNFNWKISRGNLVQKGSTTVSIEKATFTIELTMKNSLNLEIIVSKCEFKISKFKAILADNSGSGMINWVLEAVNAKLKDTLEIQISALVKNVINGYVTKVNGFTEIEIADGLVVSVKLTEIPEIDTEHLKIAIEGLVKLKGMTYEFTIPDPVDLSFTTSQALQITVSEYSLNSALFTFHISKMLSFSTSSFDIGLNTNNVKNIFPGIDEQYGKKNIDISCQTSKNPLISLDSQIVYSDVELACSMLVEEETDAVLVVSTCVKSKAKVFMEELVVKGEFEEIVVNEITLVSSELKNEPNLQGVKDLLNLSLKLGRKKINEAVFGKGITLPAEMSGFVDNLQISVNKGFITVEGSPKYPN